MIKDVGKRKCAPELMRGTKRNIETGGATCRFFYGLLRLGSAGLSDAAGISRIKIGLEQAKRWARHIRRDIVALWIAARDPRVPWPAKLVAALVAAYALSPVDLIPDFIPIIGYLDDLVLVPLGITLAIKLIPATLFAELQREAARHDLRLSSKVGAGIIITLWLVGAALMLRYLGLV